MPHPSAGHAGHDQLVIAAYAAGDATGPDLDAAAALVATCDECAVLHHDLRAIATATASLPAPVRTRDFRLTGDQAASLRPAGWRRLLAPFAGPRFAFAGPLGGGLAALGIAGVLVAGGLGIPMGGAASAPAAATDAQAESDGAAAAAAASAAPAEMPAAESAAAGAGDGGIRAGTQAGGGDSNAAASPDVTLFAVPLEGVEPSGKTDGSATGNLAPPGAGAYMAERDLASNPTNSWTSSTEPLGLLAGVMLVVGLGLAGLRLGARLITRRTT